MRKALPYVFALLSATAITIDTASVSEVSAPLTGFNAASLTAVLLFAAFCLLFKNAKVSKTSICAAAVMGLCHIIGRTFFNRDSLYLICGSKSEALRSLIIFIGVTAILAVLIERLFAYFETATPNKKPLPFLATWGIIFVCWIPYLLCRPPLFGWDTMAQIDMFFGKWPMYNGHPVISTFFYGLFAKFGIALGSVNISMYFLSVSQSLLFSAALAYCLKRTRNLPKAVYFVFLAVFALVPVFSVFGTVAEKNSVYAVFVLLFTIFAYDVLRGNPTKKQTVGLIVSAVMCILFRLNGVHVILPTLVIFMFGKSAAKKQIAVATIATVSVYIGTNYILLAVMNIPHGRAIEALSLPIQQSARYAREYSKETPQSEKNVLNKIFDYDDAIVSYNPQISDPVKKGYIRPATKVPPTKADFAKYFKVWLAQFKRHPKTYFEASLNNTYTYCSFYDSKLGLRCFPTVHSGSIGEASLEKVIGYRFKHIFPNESPNIVYRSLAKVERAALFAPLFAPLCRIALYTYLLMAVIAYAIKTRKKKLLAVCLPSALSFLVCIASPVNGDFRYAIAYVVCVPFLIGLCFEKNKASAQ